MTMTGKYFFTDNIFGKIKLSQRVQDMLIFCPFFNCYPSILRLAREET